MIIEYLKTIRDRMSELCLSVLEFKANSKHNSINTTRDIEGKILVLSHSLEKGMGMTNVRIGFGQKKAHDLATLLLKYIKKVKHTNSFAFNVGFSMLKRYVVFQDELNFDVAEIKDLLVELEKNVLHSNYVLPNDDNLLPCGFFNFTSPNSPIIDDCELEQFFRNRHSIRHYNKKIIDRSVIEKAVSIANLSPSACNRQPCKVYCTSSETEANYVDELITGSSGFKGEIPNFAVITASRCMFSGREQFQWYINGGIYTSFFVLALHSLGLGSIIMQWFAFYKTEKKLKKYFGIEDNEAIIAIIGFGECSPQVKCLIAERKSVKDTLVFRKCEN